MGKREVGWGRGRWDGEEGGGMGKKEAGWGRGESEGEQLGQHTSTLDPPFFTVAGMSLHSAPDNFFSKIAIYGVLRGEGEVLEKAKHTMKC